MEDVFRMQWNHSRSCCAWLASRQECYRHCMEWTLSCTKWSTVSSLLWLLKEMRNRKLFRIIQLFVAWRWLSHPIMWKYSGGRPQQRLESTGWKRGWLTAFFFWNDKNSDIFKVNFLKLYRICSHNGILDIWYCTDQNNNLQIKINNIYTKV